MSTVPSFLTLRQRAHARLRRGGFPYLAVSIVLLAALAAVAPAALTPYDPLAESIAERLLPPSFIHPFGTDDLGRDLLSRVVYGAWASLSTATLALGFALVASVAVGLAAGYLRGPTDRALMGVIDVLLAVPSLLISLLVVSGLGAGAFEIALAVGIASVPAFARLTRAEVLRVSSETYVEAARGFGLGRVRVLVRHVLPRACGPLAALSALEFAAIVLSVSVLSFLGYGVQPPTPEWGSLIAQGRDHFATAWWLISLPGLVLTVVVVAVHRIGAVLGASRGGVR
jgi:peptide/nickel transport system permease protein